MIVEVVKYDLKWPADFAREARLLKEKLGPIMVQAHHIGSTAVPGLMAKPIIDILLEVSDLPSLDTKNTEMKILDYEVMGAYGIPGRRYFRKGGDHRTHQIHAFQKGDAHLKRHLAFRDYLIAHPEVAQKYGQLKFDIAQRIDNDIEKYSDEKDPFIQLHEPKALEWYEKRSSDQNLST